MPVFGLDFAAGVFPGLEAEVGVFMDTQLYAPVFEVERPDGFGRKVFFVHVETPVIYEHFITAELFSLFRAQLNNAFSFNKLSMFVPYVLAHKVNIRAHFVGGAVPAQFSHGRAVFGGKVVFNLSL